MTYKVQGKPLQTATPADLSPSSTPLSAGKIVLMVIAAFTVVGLVADLFYLGYRAYKTYKVETVGRRILQMGTLLGRTSESQFPGTENSQRSISPQDDWQYEAQLRLNLIDTNASLPPVTQPKRRIAAEPHDNQIIAAYKTELCEHITVHLKDMPAGAVQNNLLLAQAKLHNGTLTLQELDEYILEPLKQFAKTGSRSYCLHRIPLIRGEITHQRVDKGGTPVYTKKETEGMFQSWCDRPFGRWTEESLAEHEALMKAEERYYVAVSPAVAAPQVAPAPKKPRPLHALKAQAAPKTTLTGSENSALEKEEAARRAAAYPHVMNEYGHFNRVE